jgi:hypothetical protein
MDDIQANFRLRTSFRVGVTAFFITNKHIKSMERNPSWEADRHSASE